MESNLVICIIENICDSVSREKNLQNSIYDFKKYEIKILGDTYQTFTSVTCEWSNYE